MVEPMRTGWDSGLNNTSLSKIPKDHIGKPFATTLSAKIAAPCLVGDVCSSANAISDGALSCMPRAQPGICQFVL